MRERKEGGEGRGGKKKRIEDKGKRGEEVEG
jgi:hypothetical protein